jgi:NADH-dependent peroxiredoxin subunit F
MREFMKELTIIGGGAAGITASIYAARKYIDTVLITDDFTGQIGASSWIENYPGFKRISGLDLINNFKQHLDLFDNIEVRSFEKVKDIQKIEKGFRIITDESMHSSKAIIIATGSTPKKLGVDNESEFFGKGVSYCVTCDGTAFKDKVVTVVGGGNAGVEATLELSRYCKKVFVMEVLDQLSADEILCNELKNNNNIHIITSARIRSFDGRSVLENVIYDDLRSKEEKSLAVDGCFIEIGSNPNTNFVSDLVKLNKKGEIEVDPVTFETSVAGIFGAGDVVNLPGKQIIIACGHGASAVLSTYAFLNKK